MVKTNKVNEILTGAKVLAFIFTYVGENGGISPTYQEVADGVGITKSNAARYIRRFMETGELENTDKNSTRSIVIPYAIYVPGPLPNYLTDRLEALMQEEPEMWAGLAGNFNTLGGLDHIEQAIAEAKNF